MLLVVLIVSLMRMSVSVDIKSYSSVWSGKTFPNRAEKRVYFFAIPFSFNSNVNYEGDKMTLTVPSKSSDKGNLELVNKGVKNMTVT